MSTLAFRTVERDSLFTRLDFRPKLFMIAVITVVAFFWEDPLMGGGLALTVLLACLAAGVASGAALSMTLSACYGAGCAGGRCTEQTYPPPGSECEDPALDANGDGYCDAAESDAESGSSGARFLGPGSESSPAAAIRRPSVVSSVPSISTRYGASAHQAAASVSSLPSVNPSDFVSNRGGSCHSAVSL